MHPQKKILLLALGNDIMGDDGSPLVAAEKLNRLYENKIRVEQVFGGGFELLDYLEGHNRALIIDTITTGKNPVGTIIEYSAQEFNKVVSSSPHYVGLPEVINISKILDIEFPEDIKILAVETSLQLIVREGLSYNILMAIPELVDRAVAIIDEWLNSE